MFQRSAVLAIRVAAALVLAPSLVTPAMATPTIATQSTSPAAVMARLLAGNQRFVAGHLQGARSLAARRQALIAGQAPEAMVLGCSDSRVPPELLFDVGLGDLFVTRVAGNVVDDVVLGSLEYAAEHLGAGLLVVLGHADCGAVKAVLDGPPDLGHIPALARLLQPAVDMAQGQPGDRLANAIDNNVLLTVRQLKTACPLLRPLVQAGKLTVMGARYDLTSGVVTVLVR